MRRLAISAVIVAVAGGALWAVQPAQQPGPAPHLNKDKIHPSVSLSDWKGLRARVYFRMDFNPRAGLASYSSGVSASGLGTVAEMPLDAQGVLSAVGTDAIVVTGPNGHLWIPRDQIRAIEVIQDPPTGP